MTIDQGTLEGFACAQEGADRAIAKADGDTPDWAAIVKGFLAAYIKTRPWFTSEDFWMACEAAGIPKPNDRRAYGGILRGATGKSIRKLDVKAYSKLPRLHGNHLGVYERL